MAVFIKKKVYGISFGKNLKLYVSFCLLAYTITMHWVAKMELMQEE